MSPQTPPPGRSPGASFFKQPPPGQPGGHAGPEGPRLRPAEPSGTRLTPPPRRTGGPGPKRSGPPTATADAPRAGLPGAGGRLSAKAGAVEPAADGPRNPVGSERDDAAPIRKRPWLARHTPLAPVVVTNASCSAVGDADPQSLGVTYWFDAEPVGEPYAMTVHLTGRLQEDTRSAERSTPDGPRREFTTVATLEDVVPGSGRVAFTTRIPNLAAGEWEVDATPVRPATPGTTTSWVEVRSHNLPRGRATGPTAFAPLARNLGPGVQLGAWPSLVGTGFALALLVQAALASQFGLPWLPLLLVSLGASVAGLLGAKAYFLLTHPGEARSFTTPGLSVQGFVITTLAILLAGAALLDLPPGAALDTTGPSLLVGMAVGRWGCLFGGCCAGRPTASRWGLWSSDRRVGVRRIPVQVMESSLAAVLATAALMGALKAPGAGSGLVLVSSVAAYVLGRQLLFPLRSVARATTHGRLVTLVTASLVLPVATTLLLLG